MPNDLNIPLLSDLMPDKQTVYAILHEAINAHTPEEWLKIGQEMLKNTREERMSFEQWNRFLEEALEQKTNRKNRQEAQKGRGRQRGGSARGQEERHTGSDMPFPLEESKE